MNTKPIVEERIWAVFAHLSTLAMGIGLPLPIVGWSQNRRKSNYASFQCLQALGYQTLGYTIWILATLVFLVVSSVGFSASIQTIDTLEADHNAWTAAYSLFIFGLIALYFVLPVIGAVPAPSAGTFAIRSWEIDSRVIWDTTLHVPARNKRG